MNYSYVSNGDIENEDTSKNKDKLASRLHLSLLCFALKCLRMKLET